MLNKIVTTLQASVNICILHTIAILILSMAMTEIAMAQTMDSVIISVGNGLITVVGGNDIGGVAGYLADQFVFLINAVAVLVMIVSGTMMALAQSEEQTTSARRAFIGSLMGIAIVFIAGPVRNAIVDPAGGGIATVPVIASGGISEEIRGIIEWMLTPIAAVAVLMIIVNGIRAITQYGSDEGLTIMRRAVFSAVIGLTIISLRTVITGSLGLNFNAIPIGGTPDDLITSVIGIVNILLGFIAMVAVSMIILAGIMMIVNVGNDEQYTRARDLIIRVAIGLLVLIASFALVNVIFTGVSV